MIDGLAFRAGGGPLARGCGVEQGRDPGPEPRVLAARQGQVGEPRGRVGDPAGGLGNRRRVVHGSAARMGLGGSPPASARGGSARGASAGTGGRGEPVRYIKTGRAATPGPRVARSPPARVAILMREGAASPRGDGAEGRPLGRGFRPPPGPVIRVSFTSRRHEPRARGGFRGGSGPTSEDGAGTFTLARRIAANFGRFPGDFRGFFGGFPGHLRLFFAGCPACGDVSLPPRVRPAFRDRSAPQLGGSSLASPRTLA